MNWSQDSLTQRSQCKHAPARAPLRASLRRVDKSSHGSRSPVAYRQAKHVAVAVKRMRETVRPGLKWEDATTTQMLLNGLERNTPRLEAPGTVAQQRSLRRGAAG